MTICIHLFSRDQGSRLLWLERSGDHEEGQFGEFFSLMMNALNVPHATLSEKATNSRPSLNIPRVPRHGGAHLQCQYSGVWSRRMAASSQLAWATQWVPSQPCLKGETRYQKTKKSRTHALWDPNIVLTTWEAEVGHWSPGKQPGHHLKINKLRIMQIQEFNWLHSSSTQTFM